MRTRQERESALQLHAISIKHNFETAHRLYTVPGKCQNLHGHSWIVEATIEWTQLDSRGMVIEYGELKKLFRTWIDTRLDHGTMLNSEDPLIQVFRDHGMRHYTFDGNPTVENVAQEIAIVLMDEILPQCENGDKVQLTSVTVSETATNSAHWACL